MADFTPESRLLLLAAEINIIKIIQKKFPRLIQVACFDTAFHTTIPAVAKTFAIPKKYFEEGIQRYGFHGISYTYLMQQLTKQNAEDAKDNMNTCSFSWSRSIKGAISLSRVSPA